MPPNKPSLQKLNQLIRIELLTSTFLENFGSYSQFPERGNARFDPGSDPAKKVKGAISVIFGGQVSSRVYYCKRDEAHFTTLL